MFGCMNRDSNNLVTPTIREKSISVYLTFGQPLVPEQYDAIEINYDSTPINIVMSCLVEIKAAGMDKIYIIKDA